MKPERKEIKPKTDDQEDSSEAEALQLEDMPARYRLNLNAGIQLYVRPTSTGILSTLVNMAASLKSYLIIRPLRMLWNGLRRQSFTEIVIYLSDMDARSLYWSFQEGIQCIIWSE